MTDKPLKTEGLRRLNKTQLYKQEENQTKTVKKTQVRGETKSKEEVKKIKQRD